MASTGKYNRCFSLYPVTLLNSPILASFFGFHRTLHTRKHVDWEHSFTSSFAIPVPLILMKLTELPRKDLIEEMGACFPGFFLVVGGYVQFFTITVMLAVGFSWRRNPAPGRSSLLGFASWKVLPGTSVRLCQLLLLPTWRWHCVLWSVCLYGKLHWVISECTRYFAFLG